MSSDRKTILSYAPDAIIAFALVFKVLSYWIWSLYLHPGTALDLLLMFRPSGDPDYFPGMSAFARLQLSETVVRESTGTGLRSFPFASVALHAFFYRFAGVAGFIGADVLVTFLLYLTLKW